MDSNFTYKQTERNPDLFTVGVQTGDYWEPESDHRDPQKAAERCNFLNGGNTLYGVTKCALEELMHYVKEHGIDVDNEETESFDKLIAKIENLL